MVTDPPYGRATTTRGEGSSEVVQRLYQVAPKVLDAGARLVICLPSRSMLPREDTGLAVEEVFPMRVHRSLTRHVCVISVES